MRTISDLTPKERNEVLTLLHQFKNRMFQMYGWDKQHASKVTKPTKTRAMNIQPHKHKIWFAYEGDPPK